MFTFLFIIFKLGGLTDLSWWWIIIALLLDDFEAQGLDMSEFELMQDLPLTASFDPNVIVFAEKEWHNTTVGEIFDYYVETAKSLAAEHHHVLHVSPLGLAKRLRVIEYFHAQSNQRLPEIIDFLVRM